MKGGIVTMDQGWRFEERVRVSRMRRVGPIGNVHATYRWPRRLPRVQSDLLSWDNLDLCGGWGPLRPADEATPIARVLAGLKPVGLSVFYVEADGDPPAWQRPEADRIRELAGTAAASPGFRVTWRSMPWSQASTLERVLVARDAPFGELYDLGAIASFYDEAGLRVARDVASLRDRPVQSGWMWERSAETDLELVACGLALGYPLESTAALLLGTGP